MKRSNSLIACGAIILLLMLGSGSRVAAEEKSADQIAKELANPAGSLASLNFSLE